MHPAIFIVLGLALSAAGLTQGSLGLTLAGMVLAGAGIAAIGLSHRSRAWSRWRDWGSLRGLVPDTEDYDFTLKGARRGQPVLVHFDADRVHAACRLERPVERTFPLSARLILSHIHEADELRIVPTPTLRDPDTRAAWRRVLEAGTNVRVLKDEVRITVPKQRLQTHELDAVLDDVADLAEQMLIRRAA